MARPVLSGDREERLRAQGVPAAIVASMRAFEEQQLRQKPAPALLSRSLSAGQPPEPRQACDDASAPADAVGSSKTSAERGESPEGSPVMASAPSLDRTTESSPGLEQSSAGLQYAASASGHAESMQHRAPPLGQDHDRVGAAEYPAQAEHIESPAAAPQQGGVSTDESNADSLTPGGDCSKVVDPTDDACLRV